MTEISHQDIVANLIDKEKARIASLLKYDLEQNNVYPRHSSKTLTEMEKQQGRTSAGTHVHMSDEYKELVKAGQQIDPLQYLTSSTSSHVNPWPKQPDPRKTAGQTPSWASPTYKTSGKGADSLVGSIFGKKVLDEYATSWKISREVGSTSTVYTIDITQEKLARLLEGRSHLEPLSTVFLEDQIANYDDQLDKNFVKGYLAAIEVFNDRKSLEDFLPDD